MSNYSGRFATLRTYLAAAGLLLLGCFIGFIVRDRMNGKPKQTYTSLREPGWEYVNPLLDCEQARNILQDDELRPIEQSIEDFIKHRLNRSWAREVTVYYRELNDGPWFAIGNTEKFRPASLLKVPLMISVLKQAETDPGILRKKVRFDDREIAALPNTVTKAMQFGRTYTVEELLEQMIVYSDNIATYLLDNVVDLDILRQTYRDLGLPNPYRRVNSPPVVVAASDYMKVLPNLIAEWAPRRIACLGTDGFGRSESRAALRDFFEVDARHIAFAALTELLREKQIEPAVVKKAIKELEINPGKPDPVTS